MSGICIISSKILLERNILLIWCSTDEQSALDRWNHTFTDDTSKDPYILYKCNVNISIVEIKNLFPVEIRPGDPAIWAEAPLNEIIRAIELINVKNKCAELCAEISTHYKDIIINKLSNMLPARLAMKLLSNKNVVSCAFAEIIPDIFADIHFARDVDIQRHATKLLSLL